MDFHDLNLNLILVLHALFLERSVSRAASRLKVSQPTVSLSLAKLREHFNDDLFVRRGARMEPTPVALHMAEPVERIIAILREDILSISTFDPHSTKRAFNLAMTDIAELVVIPPLFNALRARAPGASIRCQSLATAELRESMANGAVDLAIGYYPDLSGAGFFQQGLFAHPFTCLVRGDHSAIGDTMTLDEFERTEHVAVSDKGRSQLIAERRMADLSLTRNIAMQSPHFMTLPFLVAQSDLIALVPYALGQAFCRQHNLKLVPPPFDLPDIEIKQYWHQRVHRDASIAWLRNLVWELLGNHDPSTDRNSRIFIPDQKQRSRI